MLDAKPSIAISMKIPQHTPSAVRNVRSRLLRSVAQTSCQLSRSNMMVSLLVSQGVDGVDAGGGARGEEAGERTGDHQADRRGDADAQVDRRIADELVLDRAAD